jgi:hypothetical protein
MELSGLNGAAEGVSTSNGVARRDAWARLAVVVLLAVAALTAVSLFSRSFPAPRRPFNAAHLKKMRRVKPHYVVVGNSMVGTRIHPPTLSKALAPRRAVVITEPGSMSSRWYLFLKYSIIPSRQRPQRVFFFFRDRELTSPRYRITGKHAPRIERAAPVEDPVLVQKLAPPLRQEPMNHLRSRLAHLVPIERMHDATQERVNDWAMRVSGLLARDQDPDARRASINSVFALASLRDVPNEGDIDLDPDLDFSRVEGSFLPDILDLAKSAQIPLAFVRVRGRSHADGIPDPKDLKGYLAKLKGYVEGHGALFFDMSTESWETSDMYGSTDHIRGKLTRRYTQLFVEHMAHLFN